MPAPAAPRPAWRSPLTLLTGGAVLAGVALIAIVALAQGGGRTGGDATAGLTRPSREIPATLENGRTLGRADAPATLDVWSDFQCPACGKLAREVEQRLIADYVTPGYVRIVYRDRAFLGDESVDAAVAARCAGDQGKFWPYHDYLFWNQKGENEGAFARDRLVSIADAVGLDRGAFEACLGSGAPRDATDAETREGARLGVVSTPTLAIGGQLRPGAPSTDEQYAALGEVIRQTVEKAGGSLPPAPSSSAP